MSINSLRVSVFPIHGALFCRLYAVEKSSSDELSCNTSSSGDVESLQLAVERERSFKLDQSALSSGVVVEGNVAEKDEDNQDGIRFATLKFRFKNKETVINW